MSATLANNQTNREMKQQKFSQQERKLAKKIRYLGIIELYAPSETLQRTAKQNISLVVIKPIQSMYLSCLVWVLSQLEG